MADQVVVFLSSDTFNIHFILKLVFRCSGTSRPTLSTFIYTEACVQVFRYFASDTFKILSDTQYAALSCTSSDTLDLVSNLFLKLPTLDLTSIKIAKRKF